MALEDKRLWLEVNNYDGSLKPTPNTATVEAFEFHSERELWKTGTWECQTTSDDADTIRALFTSGDLEPQNARVFLREGESKGSYDRTLAAGVFGRDRPLNVGDGVARFKCGTWSVLLERGKTFITVPSGDIDAEVTGQSIIGLNGSDPQGTNLNWGAPHKSPLRYLYAASQHGEFATRFTTNAVGSGFELYDSGSMGTDRSVVLSPDRNNVRGTPTVERPGHFYTHLTVLGTSDSNNSDLRLSKQAALSQQSSNDDQAVNYLEEDPSLDSQTDVDDRFAALKSDLETDSGKRTDIELTAVSLSTIPDLGDGYKVDLPSRDIAPGDGHWTVIAVAVHLDSDEERYDLTLSNRTLVRPDWPEDNSNTIQQHAEGIGKLSPA